MVYKIDDATLDRVREAFGRLEGEVRLTMFTGDKETCLYCNDLEGMADQIAGLSPLVKVTKGLNLGSEEAKKLKIDKHPATIIGGAKDFKVRYFGMPMGHEFLPFIDTLVDASTGKPELDSKTIDRISKIKSPIHIQVFTTPTCPYCPPMVRTAHKMAMINENITSDMIDAMEFMELAQKYQVSSVPRTIINEVVDLLGAYPESDFVDKVVEAAHTRDYSV
ncbi:MAG: thioredoxin family protein [Candidatus Hydrothermarchaeales archaeon]